MLTSRSRRALTAVAAAAGLLAWPAPAGADGQGHCPAAESLVPGTTWHHHQLGKGVSVSSGTTHDADGIVNMHVLRVDLAQPRVRLRPLVHSVAQRLPLSRLSAHQRHLVAATNTGYFDFRYGAPTDPLIVGGSPRVLSATHQTVVGVGKAGRMQAGRVWDEETVTSRGASAPLAGVNEVYAEPGVTVYDRRWGSAAVPGGADAVRAVVGGVVSPLRVPVRGATVPSGGYLLQARGRDAAHWVDGLTPGAAVTRTGGVGTDAASPFTQAYGVGVQIVATAGVPKTGFSCNSANTKTPARTAIGWSHGGRKLVVAVVADHPHTSLHGLDEDQMSKLMVQLGASQAYAFDGSGSSELLARLPGGSGLTRLTYPADGTERPMPVGLGVELTPARRHHHR